MYLEIGRRSEQSDATDSPAELTARNVDKAIARGGKAVVMSDAAGLKRLGRKAWASVELPRVDQPRNLAKSVSVE